MAYPRCAWCDYPAEGTALDEWYDPYYGLMVEEWPSCGYIYCGFEFIEYPY